MARHRRQRVGNRKASAFAPGTKGGRALTWESLSIDVTTDGHDSVFNVLAFAAGGFDIRYQVLLPPNVTRGVVTLERLRMEWDTYFRSSALSLALPNAFTCIPWNIQLVPVRDGVIDDTAVLDPRNTADTENNAILARGLRTPLLTDTAGATIGAVRSFNCRQDVAMDIKSKRRFDRSLWALIMVCSGPSGLTLDWLHNIDIRALFLASDGV